jgi:phosphoenolpyruvate carboxykinase (ATP)
LEIVTRCPGVPEDVLLPRKSWADAEAYDRAAAGLHQRFEENMANLGNASSFAG